jgi:hypothetical protein
MGVKRPSARGAGDRAVAWLAAGIAAYTLAETIASPSFKAPLPAGGWRELGVSAAIFVPIEVAGLLVAGAVLAEFAALASALLLWRGYAIAGDTAAKFAYLGAWLLFSSWPLEAVFLFVRGNHVPGSPGGWATALFVAVLIAIEGATLWRVARARRDSGDAAQRDDALGGSSAGDAR